MVYSHSLLYINLPDCVDRSNKFLGVTYTCVLKVCTYRSLCTIIYITIFTYFCREVNTTDTSRPMAATVVSFDKRHLQTKFYVSISVWCHSFLIVWVHSCVMLVVDINSTA